MYFNTTNESKEQVEVYTGITGKQDKQVLEIIKTQNKPFSASFIWKRYIHLHVMEKTPITSIRRSLNTLKRIGLIEETGNKVIGIYGRNENLYKISDVN